MSDQERFLGKFKMMHDETTLAGRDGCRLNWSVREYIGSEICKTLDHRGRPVPLTCRSDVQPGDAVMVPGMLGEWRAMTVDTDGRSAASGGLMAILEFDRDDRHCWVCGGLVNAAAIARVDFR